MLIHVVKKGETLSFLAGYYQVPVWKIIYDNQIRLPDRLVPGQALLILGSPNETEAEKREKKLNLIPEGYAYPFTYQEYLREAFSVLENLLSFSAGFSMEGALYPPMDLGLRNLAEEYGVSVTLVLTPSDDTGIFSNELVSAVASQEEVQNRLVDELEVQVLTKNYRGVDVDFEYIRKEDKEGYISFVEKLTERMHQTGHVVSVALAPKISDNQPGLLYEGVDYQRLGGIADSVLLMTYEWGYTYGPPMAVAPLHKVNQVVEYAVTRIPVEKIFMGIPNYAYDWVLPFERGKTKATTIGNEDAVQIAAENGADIQFDETAQSPWFRYTRNEIEHEVWFEDVRSIEAKLLLASSYGLKGITYWNLLRPFRANWLLLSEMLELEK